MTCKRLAFGAGRMATCSETVARTGQCFRSTKHARRMPSNQAR